jgi:hypothetical protein
MGFLHLGIPQIPFFAPFTMMPTYIGMVLNLSNGNEYYNTIKLTCNRLHVFFFIFNYIV